LTTESYLERSEDLSREADVFIGRIGLLQILKPFGDAQFFGSYAVGLMDRRDIDALVATDLADFSLVTNLMGQLRPLGFTRFWVYDNLGKACSSDARYIVCEAAYRFYEDGLPLEQQWTVGVSFCLPEDKDDCFRVHRRVVAALRDDSSLRATIVRLKHQLYEAYGHRFSGTQVYQAVLDRGFRSVEDFRQT
jgi:hypothetical protein